MNHWTHKTILEQYAIAHAAYTETLAAGEVGMTAYGTRARAHGVLQGIAAVYAGIEGIDPQVAGDELRDLISEEATR